MKKIISIIYILFSVILLFYVALPNFDFPSSVPNSVQSNEPADTETPLRRAYFTDYSRAEVLDWYKNQFTRSRLLNITLPTYLMNYPPEESGSIIRDQTRSTFLQEFVHPFRETLFINGYEPAPDDDTNRIVIDGRHWRQKIIVKYVPNNRVLRLLVTSLSLLSFLVLYKAFVPEFKFFKARLKKIK